MKTFLLILVLSLMASCAHDARKRQIREPSEALRVARAVGFTTIQDIHVETLKSVDPRYKGPGTSATADAAKGAGIATGLVKPTPGLSPALETSFLLLGALFGTPPTELERSPRLIAWMPRDLASTPQAATVALRDLWFSAIAATLPDAHVEFGQREVPPKKRLLTRPLLRYIRIDTPTCTDCRLYSPAMEEGAAPVLGKAPSFLGSYDAYIWGPLKMWDNSTFSGYPWTDSRMEPSDRVEFLIRLSSHFPKWVYLYTPTDEKVSIAPLILHQGEALRFVEPGLDDPAVDQQTQR
jgi:hypothetical protein